LAVALASVTLCLAPSHSASAKLPDERVWEQVSPADKRATDVIPKADRTHVSVSGDRVIFLTLTAFGDTQGVAASADYLAVRDADDSGRWSSHGISPPQDATGYFETTNYLEPTYEEVSTDLSKGIMRTRSRLVAAPNVASALNLYRRNDLLSSGGGAYQLLTDSPTVQPPSSFFTSFLPPDVADVTGDLSHGLFESRRVLTADAPPCGDPTGASCPLKLYEWVDTTLRLAGMLPPSEGGGAAPESQAGRGAAAHLPYGTLSQDGSRVIFTGPPFDPAHEAGSLYLRDDYGTPDVLDDSTVRIDAPESATPLSGPSTFWAASDDASKVFFTNGGQLYRYDLDAASDHHLTLVSVDSEPSDNASAGGVEGAIGTSTDGRYVYFLTDQNQLVAGGPIGPTGGPIGGMRMYVWHDGTIREVGAVNAGFDEGLALLGETGPPNKTSRITPDGRHLVFISAGTDELLSLYGHAEYDHGTGCPARPETCRPEVYVYDATANGGTGDLRCASCNPIGAPATSNANFTGESRLGGTAASTNHQNSVLSDDGRFVFFNTGDRLQPEDQNDVMDAYEFDTTTGRVHLISSGHGTANSSFVDASPDGHDVFFTTREQLRSSDTDQSRDLYDARIGGTPDPGVVPTSVCDGESCKPVATQRSPRPSPASEMFLGRGDELEVHGPPPIFALEPLSAKQRKYLAHRGRAELKVQASQRGTITIRVRARIGGRVRVIQTLHRTLEKGGTLRLGIRLGRAARRQLIRVGRVRVVIGADYSQTPARRVLRLTLTR